MIGVTIKVDAIERALRTYADQLSVVARTAVMDGSDAAQVSATATLHATTTRRTGAAEDSWIHIWRGPYKRLLRNTSGHAGFIESGTAAHIIAARRTKFLRFEMNGQTMFRRSVRHPGTKARPFLALAAAAGQMAMKASAQAGADRIARQF